jgi:hypothetical protein
VDLFTNLSWNDINAIFPAGVCVDGGVLNGYAMTGWTWASIDEVNALFNSFLIATGLSGEDLLGPGVASYQETGSVWATDFFGSDWLPTLTDLPALQTICGWTSELHWDEVTEGLIQWSPSSAIPDLVATGNIFTDDSLKYLDESAGAWLSAPYLMETEMAYLMRLITAPLMPTPIDSIQTLLMTVATLAMTTMI